MNKKKVNGTEGKVELLFDNPARNEIELAYMAGIIDGEGSISISGKGVLTMSIFMTHKETIAWLAKKLGARTVFTSRTKLARKDAYSINICGKNAKAIIEQIKPYMITKKAQAELAMAYPILIQGQHTTDDYTKLSRKVIKNAMDKLNNSWQYRRRNI